MVNLLVLHQRVERNRNRALSSGVLLVFGTAFGHSDAQECSPVLFQKSLP